MIMYVIVNGFVIFILRQESPPAWTQEAYCPPCSKYSLCCPNWVPPPSWPGRGGTLLGGYLTWVAPARVPPILTWPGGTWLGTPQPGYPPPGYPTPPTRVPPDQRTSHQGTPSPTRVPPARVPPQWLPHGILGNVAKHYGIWVAPPPPTSVCPMAFWEMLQSIMGYGYPPLGVDKLTKWNYYLPVVLRTRAVKMSQ